MQETPNLKLKKPNLTDYVNVGDLNENMDVLDEEVNNVKEKASDNEQSLTTHLADNMYQIPTIEGTQIRINRLSNTDRLFFKLDNDLTGDITISTDSGATDKPLLDIEENQVTQLEKGFVEVVADADFFILRNRGISADDRQALIDIVNEAERNESDLKTQFIDAVNEVDTDGGINLPADAPWAEVLANVPSIKTGKKWASGVFQENDFIVTGLAFEPSAVIVGKKNSPSSGSSAFWGFVISSPDIFGEESDISAIRNGHNLSTRKISIEGNGFFSMQDLPRNEEVIWIAFE